MKLIILLFFEYFNTVFLKKKLKIENKKNENWDKKL